MTVRLSRLWQRRRGVTLPEEIGRGRGRVVEPDERLVVEAGERAGVPERIVGGLPRTDVEVRELVAGVAGRRAVVRASRLGAEVGAEVEVLGPELHGRRRLRSVGGRPRTEHVVAE